MRACEKGNDFRAPRVVIRELEARFLAERGHPLAHGALGQALCLQDGVHLGLERGELLAAPLVDFIRRHQRRGTCPERPGVVGIALRKLPHAGVAGRARSLCFQFGGLALERGGDLVGGDFRGLCAEIARHFRRVLRERGHQRPVGDISAARGPDLGQRLVEQEIRRDDALRRRDIQSPGLAVELARIRFQPREVGLRILPRLHGVLLDHEARDLEESAGILRDDIGRVSPGPVLVEERHVAVREGEARGSGFMRRAHDIQVDARRLVQAEASMDCSRSISSSAEASMAFSRSSRFATRPAMTDCPAAVRSVSLDFSGARGPASMPSAVAFSG